MREIAAGRGLGDATFLVRDRQDDGHATLQRHFACSANLLARNRHTLQLRIVVDALEMSECAQVDAAECSVVRSTKYM